jgi:hypothetical protein
MSSLDSLVYGRNIASSGILNGKPKRKQTFPDLEYENPLNSRSNMFSLFNGSSTASSKKNSISAYASFDEETKKGFTPLVDLENVNFIGLSAKEIVEVSISFSKKMGF